MKIEEEKKERGKKRERKKKEREKKKDEEWMRGKTFSIEKQKLLYSRALPDTESSLQSRITRETSNEMITNV